MKTFIDQMGREVRLTAPPKRIISLVPSQTELLIDIGAEVIGRTKFCLHPADKVDRIPSVGGTKKFRFDVIDALKPDLIIGNKEENYQDGILQLAESYPVWMSDIFTLPDALQMIRSLGELVEKPDVTERMATQIETGFASMQALPSRLKVGYFIWQKPLMTVGRNTYIHDLLTHCGFINPFADLDGGRYPKITPEQVLAADLDLILLSSEPFPFGEKERKAFADAYPGTAVRLVDGEMFSWYGSRLLKSAPYLRELMKKIREGE